MKRLYTDKVVWFRCVRVLITFYGLLPHPRLQIILALTALLVVRVVGLIVYAALNPSQTVSSSHCVRQS